MHFPINELEDYYKPVGMVFAYIMFQNTRKDTKI